MNIERYTNRRKELLLSYNKLLCTRKKINKDIKNIRQEMEGWDLASIKNIEEETYFCDCCTKKFPKKDLINGHFLPDVSKPRCKKNLDNNFHFYYRTCLDYLKELKPLCSLHK